MSGTIDGRGTIISHNTLYDAGTQTHDQLEATISVINSALSSKQDTSEKNQSGGYPGLVAGKINEAQLPYATPSVRGTVFGYTAGQNQTNTVIGRNAGSANTSDTNNTVVGYYAGASINTASGVNNTLIGSRAGDILTTGNNNTFVGKDAKSDTNNAVNRIAIGSGATSTADGQFALPTAITQIKVDGLGSNADATGTILTIDGSGIIRKTGGSNTTIDSIISSLTVSAATSTTLGTTYGKINTDTSTLTDLSMAVGYQIPDTLTSGTNEGNTIIGYKAIGSGVTTSGYGNTVLGCVAMNNFVSGDRNTAIGIGSGVTLSTGSRNTFIGAQADMNIGTYSNSIALGADCFAKASNEFAVAPLVTQWRSEGLSNRAPAGYSKLMFDAVNGTIRPQAGSDVWCASLGSDYSVPIASGGGSAIVSGLSAQFGSTSSWLTSGTTITIPSGFPTNGLWEITAFTYTTHSSVMTSMALNILRSDVIAASFEGANSTTNYTGRGGSRILQLTPGQTIKMRMGWGSTGTSSFSVKTDGTYISLRFLGLGTL
jgi:hypothetical protein